MKYLFDKSDVLNEPFENFVNEKNRTVSSTRQISHTKYLVIFEKFSYMSFVVNSVSQLRLPTK